MAVAICCPWAHVRAPVRGLGRSGARAHAEKILLYSCFRIILHVLFWWNPTAVLLYRSYVRIVIFKIPPHIPHNLCKALITRTPSYAFYNTRPSLSHCSVDARYNCHTFSYSCCLPYYFLFYKLSDSVCLSYNFLHWPVRS